MTEPAVPQSLGQILAWAREIVRYLRSIRVRVAGDLQSTETPSGTLIELKLPPIPKAKPINWQVYDLKKEGDAWKCRVWPGHVLCIDPKEGTADLMKYWEAEELEADPLTWFVVSAAKKIYVRVNTSNKDIPNAVSIQVLEDEPEVIHAQPPPSASENGESPPPPKDGIYYYKIADFEVDPDDSSVIRVKDQYHIGGPIIHRPVLHEFWNTEAEGGTAYKIMKGWDATQGRFEVRSLVQLDVSSTNGVPIIRPFQEGQPPYNTIDIRGIRERASGDDASDATTQIRVKPASDDKCAVVLGNGKVGKLEFQFGPEDIREVLNWSDGLVTNEGTVNVEIPLGKNLNLHVRTQSEGTDPDGWMQLPTAVKTLCWRAGSFVGAFDQASPTSIVERFAAYEEAAPLDLISVGVSSISGVS